MSVVYELLREAEAVASLQSASGYETARIPVTWDGDPARPTLVFEHLPEGRYGTCRVFSADGKWLMDFSVGLPVPDFPEFIQLYEVPERGNLTVTINPEMN